MGKHHINTLRRIRLVLDIVEKHYEPGNNAKNYYKVWERYVNPVYPCCYRTMLSYLKTGIRRRYKDLMLKELHNKEETVYAEWTEVQDERDDFAISEFYMNLESALESFHGKERKIAERILFYGESDTEAAIQEAVSRQYCNRIRKKFVRKM